MTSHHFEILEQGVAVSDDGWNTIIALAWKMRIAAWMSLIGTISISIAGVYRHSWLLSLLPVPLIIFLVILVIRIEPFFWSDV